MILDDEFDPGSSKLAPAPVPTLRLPEPVAGRASPLPDYETSQAQHTVIFRKPSFPNRFDSRFWRATFFALAIYVFLSVVIGIPLIVTRIAARRPHPPPNIQSLFLDDGDQAAAPLNPAGGIMMAEASTECDEWDTVDSAVGSLFTTTVQHTLSPNGLISIRSNATDEVVPHPGGRHNLTVNINDDASATQAVLTVTLTTSSPKLREAVHMCFASTGGSRGLSVYFPRNLAPTDVLSFDIRLLFPQSSRTLTVSNLITYLPMFHQSFGYLSPAVRFQNVNIAGAGVDIICDSLQASKIVVKTSFASITGTFNVSQSLKLDNIEGSIYTNATLNNDPTQPLPTYMSLDTGNRDIVAGVTLVAPLNTKPPKYLADVKTFNGSLSLTVVHAAATLPASLGLQVDNNQAESRVSLDSKFSGLFDLRTKLAPITVDYSQVTTDPSGAGRQWNFDLDSNSTSSTRGWLGWGMRPQDWNPATDSKVSIVSSLSPILLQLVQ
ncbi:hypothetical protein FB451DRAFT_1211760 [Mycena latifolia]|nr:hypothetical protein FB451DRAFT_1211760 [Mycena latifolia]